MILSNYDTFWEKLQAVDNEDVLQPEYKLCNGIHYDESTQLCCLHKIQNISHLTFQECCGAEIYHNGTEICIGKIFISLWKLYYVIMVMV